MWITVWKGGSEMTALWKARAKSGQRSPDELSHVPSGAALCSAMAKSSLSGATSGYASLIDTAVEGDLTATLTE